MVNAFRFAKSNPLGFLERLRYYVQQPQHLLLALQMGLFIANVPKILARQELSQFLQKQRRSTGSRLLLRNVDRASVVRIRAYWLRLAMFRSHNTCYIRALTLYRFINAPNQQVGIHFGIEQRNDPKERLRGHAWVSIDGEVLEGPQDQITGKLIEMPIGGSRT